MRVLRLCILLLVNLAACMPAPPDGSGLQAVTVVPTLDLTNVNALCSTADEAGSADWQRTIRALEGVYTLGATCPDGRATHVRLYETYVAYGAQLEAAGRIDDATAAYRMAIHYDRLGEEALLALQRLNAYTPPAPEPCSPDALNTALAVMPTYTPTQRGFTAVVGQGFYAEGAPYPIYGVNYMPRFSAWQDFLTRTDVTQLAEELDVIAGAGFNTLRVFLRYEALFTCPGSGAVPVASGFSRLDSVIQIAAERDLRVILVLHDLPDFTVYPLYTSPSYLSAQNEYLIRRYRDEPVVLAWDVRSTWGEEILEPGFSRQQMLAWLSENVAAIRTLDDQHLITAGWFHDTTASIPLVDFVSIGHRGHADELRREVVVLRTQTDKPLVLAEFGYPSGRVPEIVQATALATVFRVIENESLAGWLVWAAFDIAPGAECMPLSCPETDGYDYTYGLWRLDLSAKVGLRVVQASMSAR